MNFSHQAIFCSMIVFSGVTCSEKKNNFVSEFFESAKHFTFKNLPTANLVRHCKGLGVVLFVKDDFEAKTIKPVIIKNDS